MTSSSSRSNGLPLVASVLDGGNDVGTSSFSNGKKADATDADLAVFEDTAVSGIEEEEDDATAVDDSGKSSNGLGSIGGGRGFVNMSSNGVASSIKDELAPPATAASFSASVNGSSLKGVKSADGCGGRGGGGKEVSSTC